jgi:Domain of unknown function (DUF4345)
VTAASASRCPTVGGRSDRGLGALLAVLGSVATAEGLRGVAQGTRQVIDGGPVSPNVDSEYRFFSAWYAALGVLLISAARRPEREARVVRAAAGGFLVAACGRALSARTVGRPHQVQRALMAVEFALPAILVPWQARVARTAARVD